MTTQELLDGRKWKELHDLVKTEGGAAEVETNYLEYENGRELRDSQVGNREDKVTDAGEVIVAKIPIPFQRKIVQTSSAFLFGKPVQLSLDQDSTAEEDFRLFVRQWKSMRMDSKLLQACEICKSETRSAILFRVVSDGVQTPEQEIELEMKATVLSSKNGKIYPAFNEFGDMVAFMYEYEGKDEKGDDVVYIMVLTQTNMVRILIDGDDYKEVETKPHFFDRIPVVYMSQDYPDWHYVKAMIDRYEMVNSKFADTNDYFASPMFKAKGAVDFVPEKDQSGTVYKLDIFETDHGNVITSDLEVLTWEHGPESTKMEFENLKGLIYSLTNTPDLSFDNVKGLGNISGVALELMFMDPILKSYFDEGIFRTAVERCINVIRSGMIMALKNAGESFYQEEINVSFRSVLPENISEIVDNLVSATGGKAVLSQKRAVQLNPLVDNSVEEYQEIQNEGAVDTGGTLNLGQL